MHAQYQVFRQRPICRSIACFQALQLLFEVRVTAAQLLQELMKNLQRGHGNTLCEGRHGSLDFLYCRGPYIDAPRPNLIVLDMNTPRLSGLETLSAIRSDPKLSVIR